jgi:integrase/recombinase XerD
MHLSDYEVHAILDRLAFRRSHTPTCRKENQVGRWDALHGKHCACPFYSCGVHDLAEGFKRKPTGQITERKARQVVEKRLRTGIDNATLEPEGVSVQDAIADFLETVRSRELASASYAKYKTLMDQLQAFCDWKGYKTIQSFDHDAMDQFFKSWSDKSAKYKIGRKWTKNSLPTAKRNLKTMRLLFRRCIKRKWISEDPSGIVEVTQEPRKKRKEQVKYLTRVQMDAIMKALEASKRTDVEKQRLKALMLTMRWTGLRISDAVALREHDVKDDVVYIVTKKSKTPVQIPLPDELKTMLENLPPCDGGYLFWNRQTEGSNIKTAQGNLGQRISTLFEAAGIKDGVHLTSHRLRNTFAVHLLSKGVPLETVSLLLGHQSIQATENAYADFSQSYMDRAEKLVRGIWKLSDDETL